MTRATLPADKVMNAAAEMMKDKDRLKGTKRRLETLAYMARAAHEGAAKTIDIDLDDFELIRLHYTYTPPPSDGPNPAD